MTGTCSAGSEMLGWNLQSAVTWVSCPLGQLDGVLDGFISDLYALVEGPNLKWGLPVLLSWSAFPKWFL